MILTGSAAELYCSLTEKGPEPYEPDDIEQAGYASIVYLYERSRSFAAFLRLLTTVYTSFVATDRIGKFMLEFSEFMDRLGLVDEQVREAIDDYLRGKNARVTTSQSPSKA